MESIKKIIIIIIIIIIIVAAAVVVFIAPFFSLDCLPIISQFALWYPS
jgi:flagellar basal body-associated protein FliL